MWNRFPDSKIGQSKSKTSEEPYQYYPILTLLTKPQKSLAGLTSWRARPQPWSTGRVVEKRLARRHIPEAHANNPQSKANLQWNRRQTHANKCNTTSERKPKKYEHVVLKINLRYSYRYSVFIWDYMDSLKSWIDFSSIISVIIELVKIGKNPLPPLPTFFAGTTRTVSTCNQINGNQWYLVVNGNQK